MTSNTTTKKSAVEDSGSKSSSNNSNPKKNPKSKKKQQSSTSSTTAKQSSTQQQQQNAKTKELPKLATDPPLECTQSDFDALLGDAAKLVDYDEASSELLDCARYGTIYLYVCMHVIYAQTMYTFILILTEYVAV